MLHWQFYTNKYGFYVTYNSDYTKQKLKKVRRYITVNLYYCDHQKVKCQSNQDKIPHFCKIKELRIKNKQRGSHKFPEASK